MAKDKTPVTSLKSKRTEDFASVYANNVAVESTGWDLRLTLGELDASSGVVEQHTAVTMPWALVKLLVYLLKVQIAAFEIQNKPIDLLPFMMPAEIVPPSSELAKSPQVQEVYKTLLELRKELISSIKE